MYSNKRGIGQKELVNLLIVVFVMIVFFFAFSILKNVTKTTSDKETCRTSVLLNAKRLEVYGTEITPGLSNIKCPTKTITVNEPDKINLVLANQNYDCWDKFEKGRVKFLDPGTGNYCVLCARVKFEGDAKGKKVKGFGDFLATSIIRDDNGNPIPGVNITYLDYLSNFESSPGILKKLKDIENEDVIYTDKDYAVMFNYYKKDNQGRPELATKSALFTVAGCFAAGTGLGAFVIFSGGSGAVVLPAAGLFVKGCGTLFGSAAFGTGWLLGSDHAADWGARIMTMPYNNLKELGCDFLE